jgi:purine-nucleoside phosphorylase
MFLERRLFTCGLVKANLKVRDVVELRSSRTDKHVQELLCTQHMVPVNVQVVWTAMHNLVHEFGFVHKINAIQYDARYKQY